MATSGIGVVSTTRTAAMEQCRILLRQSVAASSPLSSEFTTNSPCSFSLIARTSLNRAASRTIVAVGRQLYQPFRPPSETPSPSSIEQDLQTLRYRNGVWHEYAAVIPGLHRAGFSPSQLDEATGVTGVEQNQLVVASQVRSTLLGNNDLVAAFDHPGGAALLYELRILSSRQRAAVASMIVEKNMEPKEARELARAVKDFERRKYEPAREFFSASSPADCLAFWWYRQSKEFNDQGERESALSKAMEYAETESAKSVIAKSMAKSTTTESTAATGPSLTVVRLETGETSGLVMLPLAEGEPGSIRAAPAAGPLGEGPFRIHRISSSTSKGWDVSWVPLPAWEPILEAESPVGVYFADGKVVQQPGEELLLVVDKGKKQGGAEELCLVAASNSNALSVKAQAELSDADEVLGVVLLALSPPKAD